MLQPGTTLQKRYIIRQALRRGDGVIYLAEQGAGSGQNVVVQPWGARGSWADFMQEAEMLRELRHPGLPELYDCLEEAGAGYFVLEHVSGQSLEALLRGRPAPFSAAEVAGWMGDVFDLLVYLHKHAPPLNLQDPSLANLVLAPSGKVRVSHLSLGTQATPDTAGFLAPELQGGLATPNAAVYIAGAIAYALVAGQTPPPALHRLMGSAELPLPSSLNPKLTPSMDQAIVTMLQPMSARRFPTLGEARSAFDAAIGGTSTASGRLRQIDLPVKAVPKPRTQPTPELTIKRATRDQKHQPLLNLRDTSVSLKNCPGCGAPIQSGPLCGKCLTEAQVTEVLQPRPPDLQELEPLAYKKPHAQPAADKAGLLGRLRAETGDMAGLRTIMVGPATVRRQGESKDLPIQIVTYKAPVLEFNATAWFELRKPVTLSLSWQRNGAKMGSASMEVYPATLLATAQFWRYTVDVGEKPPPELADYFHQFAHRKSRERSARRDVRLPCKFRVTSHDLPMFKAISADISPGGLSLLTSGPVEIGKVVSLNLDFDDYRFHPVACRSEVRWCQYGPDEEFRIGTFLKEMTPEHLATLNYYMEVVHHQRVRWNV